MSRRILLVEDNPATRKLTRIALEADGHEVVEAADAAAALQLAARAPDLVVLDLVLPDMHGIDLLACIRAEGARVPAIAMSGSVERLRDGAARGLFDECLVKPVRPSVLRDAIRAVLDDGRAVA